MFSPKKTIKKESIKELYYIIDIDNLESILQQGILSRNQVMKRDLYHAESDISDAQVQTNRDKKITSPYDKKRYHLHDFVNFYLQPNNAMLLVAQNKRSPTHLCILRVDKSILNRPGVLLTTRNAACRSAGFLTVQKWALTLPLSEALSSQCLKGSDVYIDQSQFDERKQIRQSEALLLDCVSATYISGVFVYSDIVAERVRGIVTSCSRSDINVYPHPSLFPRTEKGAAFTSFFKPFTILPQSGKKRVREEEAIVPMALILNGSRC